MKVFGYEISNNEEMGSIVISQESIGSECDDMIELSIDQLPYFIEQLMKIAVEGGE